MKGIRFILCFMALIVNSAMAVAPDSAPEDYEEKVRNALEQVVKKQIDELHDKANSTGSANEQNIEGTVLSTHIRNFSDIPKNIDDEIQQIREQIRKLIRLMATDIEIHAGNSGSLEIDAGGRIVYKPNPELPRALNEKRERLLRANMDNSVSVRSAALAVRLLAGINDQLKAQANKAQSRQEKERIYMLQAIYVYEMADITLELLDGLSLEGKETIDNMHRDAQQRVSSRVADIEVQLDKARQLQQQGLLTTEQFDKEAQTYGLMRMANEQSLDAWKDLLSTIGKQQDFIDNLKQKKELIVYKRDKARVQLETLRDIRQVAELPDAIGSLDDLVASVADLDLLVLDENTVLNLLGYEAVGHEEGAERKTRFNVK